MLLAVALYVGLAGDNFPFTRMELVKFLALSGGVSFLLMILSMLLFGENILARLFVIYAWVAIPLSLIFLTLASAIFTTVVLILLYKDIDMSHKVERYRRSSIL